MIQKITLLLLLAHIICAQDTLYVCNPGDAIELQTSIQGRLYTWSPSSSLDNPRISNPIARPSEETKYVVQVVTGISDVNLVANPDFSEGNTGFTSDYPFVTSINRQGVYGISDSAKKLNSIFFEACPDHTDGQGNMMVIDGSPTPNEKVWCQTVAVEPNSNYAFSSWLASVNPQNPAVLRFSINDEQLGFNFVASSQVCNWQQFYQVWNSENADSAQICIVNQNTNPAGNDFVLDDFAFIKFDEILYDSIVVVVEALVAARNRRVYIPSAFSPNEDGFNDVFEIFLGKGAEELRDVKIFDRWGNQVFERFNCSQTGDCFWDGNINGSPALEGSYLYTATVVYADGFIEKLTGALTLLR